MYTEKELIDKLPSHISLYFVDYRDTLQSADNIRDVMRGEFDATQNRDVRETIDWIINDTYTEEEIEFIKNNSVQQTIMDTIYERDDSNPEYELAKNTNTWFRYDLDIEIPDRDCLSKSEYNKLVRQLTKRFSKFGYKEKHIRNMLGNAPYGGQLYMLWHGGVEQIMYERHEGQTHCNICGELICFNASNGSGWGTEEHITLTVNWNPDNLILDDLDPGYGYATDLCGLCPSYYEGSIEFTKAKKDYIRIKTGESQAAIHIKQQAEFDKVYRAGGCSFLDSNMSRHRNTIYRNDYPCGIKCLDCGRFWID